MYNGSSLYGNYRTRTFTEIFDAENKGSTLFESEWAECPFSHSLEKDAVPASMLFYLLYARFGNSNIASSDEDRFKYQLFSLIFQYGPTWSKELTIQKEIREANVEAFRTGTKNVVNNAQNPGTLPTTDTLEELTYINAQNVSKTERSLADGYALMLSLLKDDITEKFLRHFDKLFLTIVQPERPLWYTTLPTTNMED